jgi:tetratricopeptide (TPR) repeat protein/MFS family permease
LPICSALMNDPAHGFTSAPARDRFWSAVLVAAVAGAGIMMVEIAAGRLISRFLGQSLYTWTSVIGVVLAGLSLGNYIGGRAADRFDPARLLAVLLWLAAWGCFLVPPLNQFAGRWLGAMDWSWPTRIFLHTATAFLLPSALLGCIGPVAARWALGSGRATGRTLGVVYAAGSLGSIVGTFLAGYWLLAAVGTTPLILLVGLVFVVMAVGAHRSARSAAAGLALAALAAGLAFAPVEPIEFWAARWGWRDRPPADAVFWRESHYQLVSVRTKSDDPTHRGMYLDKMLHSEARVGRPEELLYRYAWVYEAVMNRRHPPPRPVRVFVIGGGGYTFPMYVSVTRPGSDIAVAEIDPVVTEAAMQAFGFIPTNDISVNHADSRNVVDDWLRQRRRGERIEFDYILGDTFNDYSVPFHLTTVEFTRALAELLAPDGVYMLNMIDRYDSGLFLGAIVSTFRKVFPDVRVFFCHANLAARGTYVVVAGKQRLVLDGLSEQIRAKRPAFRGFELAPEQVEEVVRRARGLVLTDDRAPVENLLARVVALDRAENMEARYLQRGLAEAERGHLDRAIRWLREALAVNEAYAPAWYNLGVALMNQGDMDGALQAFGMAIHIEPGYVDARNNAAVILARAGYLAEAREQLEEVLRFQPDSAIAHNNLGELLAAFGERAAAREHFERAVVLDPAFARARENLARIAESAPGSK